MIYLVGWNPAFESVPVYQIDLLGIFWFINLYWVDVYVFFELLLFFLCRPACLNNWNIHNIKSFSQSLLWFVKYRKNHVGFKVPLLFVNVSNIFWCASIIHSIYPGMLITRPLGDSFGLAHLWCLRSGLANIVFYWRFPVSWLITKEQELKGYFEKHVL